MPVSDFVAALNDGTGWIALLYIFFTQVLPKIAPAYAKAINKTATREDRLFDMLATTNKNNEKLANALDRVCNALQGIEDRLEKLEDRL